LVALLRVRTERRVRGGEEAEVAEEGLSFRFTLRFSQSGTPRIVPRGTIRVNRPLSAILVGSPSRAEHASGHIRGSSSFALTSETPRGSSPKAIF
jgi:hypothetical protein